MPIPSAASPSPRLSTWAKHSCTAYSTRVVFFVFGSGTSGADAFFSESVVSPDRAGVVTIHHSGQEKRQGNSLTIRMRLHQIAANW